MPAETARLVAARTAQARAGMERARLTLAADLHLTLRFLGELLDARIDEVIGGLRLLRQPGFPLELTGVGAFRSVGAIYAVVAPSEELLRLAEAVNEILAWRGIARELRPFHPHVTLARVRRALPVAALERWSSEWEPIRFYVESAALFRRRQPRGAETEASGEMALGETSRARYELAQTFPFGTFSARESKKL